MIRNNLYIVVLGALFLAVARILHLAGFWGVLGLPEPHGYVTQGVTFLVLLFILQNTLFEPYLKVVDERENLTVRKKAAAEKTRENAERKLGEYRKTIEGARLRATLERERIGLAAETEERARVAEARRAGARLLGEALDRLEDESEAVRPELKKQVEGLAREIVNRVTRADA